LKKKKANSIPKVSGLTPRQKVIGKLVSELREQWHCSQDNLPCYIAPGIHLKLTAKLLAAWAESIVSISNWILFTVIVNNNICILRWMELQLSKLRQHIQILL